MDRRKYGTLDLVRQELRTLWEESFKYDKTTNHGTGYRDGINAALKMIGEIEDEKWTLKDLDADREKWGMDP